ncbi:MAG TPA: hypothetical protein VKT49_21280 [Bryobacteraceae bacterium]|nr:hypothetical protein [Bryobacteraceae bacterium]
MIWRLLIILFKSALMVALFELLSPVAEAVGVQLKFVATVAAAISHSTSMPYKEAEVLFLFLVATTLLEIARFLWEFLAG